MMKLFLKFELGKIVKYFKDKTLAKSITTLLFLCVFAFVGVGIYFFFVSGFRFINIEAVEDIRSALTLFLYEIFLLILSGIIVFSSMVSIIFTLFRGDYNNWIISSPGYTLFPRIIFFKSLLHSALPCLIMFLPAVIAFSNVNNLGFLSILFILLSVIFLLIILNALCFILILGTSFLYYKTSQTFSNVRFNIKGLLVLVVIITTTIVSLVWKAAKNIDLVKLFKADEESVSLNVANIGSHFAALPTHPFAMEILNWQNGEVVAAMSNFFVLLLISVVLVIFCLQISPFFYPVWKKFQDGGLQTTSKIQSSIFNTISMPYRFTGNKTMILFKKEALISSRNFKGILWFLFLLFIWLAQIGTNIILGNNVQKYQTDLTEKSAILQSLQFIIALYFICSFTLRFVFPSFSVERKTAWILGSAPLSFRRIFFGKYLFFSMFFVTLGIIMSYINVTVLNVSFEYALYSVILFSSSVVFIVTLGLVFGALFPNTVTDDPEVISTSMPGLFFTALSLIYGALTALTLYFSIINESTAPIVICITGTLILVLTMLHAVSSLPKHKLF